MHHYYEKVNELLAAGTPFVSVTVVDTAGSAPNDVGAKMIVTAKGHHFGTVGGGSVEKKAIDEALTLLAGHDPARRTHFAGWNLDQDLAMTCGGQVKLYFEKHDNKVWQIAVFGAGHVSNALIYILLKLDCRITCIDPRPEWLAKLPDSPSLQKICQENMPSCVSQLPDQAFVVIMTMGHAMDEPILIEILKTRKFPYIGVIGSDAKAAQLRKNVQAAGLLEDKSQSFFCPIGLRLGNKQPEEIALSIAAQLVQERDRLL